MKPHEVFKDALLRVTGQAFQAAGYELVGDPLQQASGLFRFRRPLASGWYAFIEFQLLRYQDTPTARFRVNLARSRGFSPQEGRNIPGAVRASLTQVLWHVYGLRDLPGPDHWWEFTGYADLAQALAEAGRLALTYGRVWLEDLESTF